ncbi:hypothetical protein EJ05DRAFT_476140 [Pseudovirgaria hyperparasitica]|uniref:Glycosyl transferase CAP10 domain-containing protein n=1 Tax=Pseudovirgaria hyperparasitica TaxID=470096 RepID=A0A6A6W5K3_9PEZI|nr:uncharacterized protein EJ05DRAFT_476140 [Pseudovirgaria hyperparasitica]KAF2757825.1 hypothetical protein EJ05DRAFT_476140 [Pseudovirgaria hyperparasitica]
MRPASVLVNYIAEHSAILLPATLFLTSTVTETATPISHSLLISSVSWAVIWIYNSLVVGFFSGLKDVTRTRLSWAAGAFFALASVCQRAAYDREGIWQFKAFLPLIVLLLLDATTLFISSPPDGLLAQDKPGQHDSRMGLAMVTILALLSLSTSPMTNQGVALGICSLLCIGAGFTTLQWAIVSSTNGKESGRGYMEANGTFSRRVSGASSYSGASRSSRYGGEPSTALRDAAAVLTISCGVASTMFESFRTDALTFNNRVDRLGGNWQVVQNGFLKTQVAVMVFICIIENALLFATVRRSGAFLASFVSLSACLMARLATGFSSWNSWTTICSGLSIVVYLYDMGPSSLNTANGRLRRRFRQFIAVLGVTTLALAVVNHIHKAFLGTSYPVEPLFAFEHPEKPLQPMQIGTSDVHPVDQLIKNSASDFQTLLHRQSKSLGAAVAEYKRRYKISPPPNFDRWYEYATRRGVQLIDEFDNIHESMTPFWGLEPATIRARAREVLGHDENFVLGVLVREGTVVKVDRGEEWQQQATVGMMEAFVQHLPDMDLAFNIHDEPRVVVPHDRLSRLVDVALNERMPKALANSSPKNAFSPRPGDMSEGKRIEPIAFTRFNQFAHQATWTHSRMSCSPNSPAQQYEEVSMDNLTSYALGNMGFVYNTTAFGDICNFPSLRTTHAFFDCPNAYNIATELFPIFSQSKISSYQDIVYPSPWYWKHKVTFEEDKDVKWEEKSNAIYWRGSTTGGYSRHGGWRRHHRQHVVRKMNGLDKAEILTNTGSEHAPHWERKEVKRSEYKELVDIHFSHVGQCDPADCDAQIEFFDVVERVDPQDAWKWKHLLDIDGNAFSGRFYAFLESTSLTYKMAIFQEWHRDWIKPWVHYIPLSLRGDEWLEILRYFTTESEGQEQAPLMASQGRKWAGKALRNEDIEVWFFRLLLEYGRVIDDDRENIGYPGP